jgi:hypothetical protein
MPDCAVANCGPWLARVARYKNRPVQIDAHRDRRHLGASIASPTAEDGVVSGPNELLQTGPVNEVSEAMVRNI